MKKIILTISLFLSLAGITWADPIVFEATVNSPRISLDEVMQLTLTFTGVNQDLSPVSLPVLDGFSAKYLGPSTSVSIVNGDYHSERSFIYDLFPNKVGHFQIPPISATVSGQTYTTKPIDVEVVQSSSQAQTPSAASAPSGQPPRLDSLKDKILISVAVDHTDVFLNEGVPLVIRLLVNDVPVRDIQFPQFDKTGLSVDDFGKPVQSSQVINGVKYDMVEFRTTIYPNHLGDVTLGPVQILGNVLYKTGQNNPFQDNNPFGSEIFNSFFDSYAARPITVTSQPIVLHVSPLPEANRPSDFSGAIGQFEFNASVSPDHVKAGDPLTLKMDVKGVGNFKSMKMPEFNAPDFKSYAPQIKNSGNTKSAEQVIIPTSANIKEVPALHFSYFDTAAKDYRTITQGPFPIQVTAPSPDQEFKAVGFSDVSHEPSAPAANGFSWGPVFNAIRQFWIKLAHSLWFWLGLGLVVTGTVSWAVWQRFQERLENDPAFARRLKAGREARSALAAAGGLIASGRAKEFYALISKVLRDYLANKWHESSAALSTVEIVRRLETTVLDPNRIHQIKALLEQSDMVCFAGAHRDASQMQTDLAQVQEVLANLERQLK